jgi:hypothetical protein
VARPAPTPRALLGWALAAPVLAQGDTPMVGEPHPEITLPDIQTGKPVSSCFRFLCNKKRSGSVCQSRRLVSFQPHVTILAFVRLTGGTIAARTNR